MKNNKKAFTIVELVIVIAIIAVLAAVLIPTFASVIKKANLSNDQSLVRNMNTTLAVEVIPNTKFQYAGDAITALNANGFVGKYTPHTTGYHFGYHIESNTMYIIDENHNVVFPNTDVSLNDLWIIWGNYATDKVDGATKYVSLVNITGGYYSTHFGDSANYTLDLAGHFIGVSSTLNNVTAINGVFISGATNSSNNTITMEEGDKGQVIAGTTESRTIIENRVFNYSEELRNKVESTANVTYKNCYFYNWNASGAGVIQSNLTFDGCTFIDAAKYVFNVQGDSDKAYEGTFTVKNCTFINCARVFNIPVFVTGEDNPGSIVITGNTFNGVTGANRSIMQLCSQKTGSGSDTGYMNITISDNTFTEIATSQAGIITLYEGIVGLSGISTEHITFSNNTVASSIPNDKLVVNDDGKPDSDFNPYNITDFKTALTNKFIAGKK